MVLARELTKRHETVLRGRLGELALEELRGELTIVVEAPSESGSSAPVSAEVDEAVDRLLSSGLSARDAEAIRRFFDALATESPAER